MPSLELNDVYAFSENKRSIFYRCLLYASVFLWIGLIIFRSEVQEDAYITFRVVKNFVHGDGLRWNLYERVQTYTNPLWMLLHIPFAFFVNDLFLTTIVLGTLCSALSVWLLLKISDTSPLYKTLFLMAPLCGLRAVIYYTNSGLENSLSYLLIVLFAYLIAIKPPYKALCRDCMLVLALAAVNRLDMLVLLAPAFIVMLLLKKIPFSFLQLLQGSLPIAAWLGFATFYYGSPLPNSYFAKLPASAEPLYLWWDGLRFLDLYFRYDPVGFGVLMLLFPLTAWSFLQYRKKCLRRDAACLSLTLGGILFFLYVLSIGGDYLMGRFWTTPTFCALICLALLLHGKWKELRPLLSILAFYTGCIFYAAYVFFCLFDYKIQQWAHGHYPTYVLVWVWEPSGDTKRNVLVDENWHVHLETNHDMLLYKNVVASYTNVSQPIIWDALGISGYFGNPQAIRIDPVGIGDAFLARLPATSIAIGHMQRTIPAGYVHAVQTGATDQMDPNLAEYYKALHLIISGPLFNMERVITLIRFQLGYYDHYRDAYLAREDLLFLRD